MNDWHRTPQQFKLLHAICADFARAFPGTTAGDFKEELLTQFPRFKAQADGKPIPPRRPRESTMTMDRRRMGEAIECLLWLGAELGVSFSRSDEITLARSA